MPNCPICHCKTKSIPRPMIATLAAASTAVPSEESDTIIDLSESRCTSSELASLVGILRNLTGTNTSSVQSIQDEDQDEDQEDEDEEEVPGTYIECFDMFEKKPKTPQTGIKSEQSETPTIVIESQLASIGTASMSLRKSADRSLSTEQRTPSKNDDTQTIPGTCVTSLHTEYSARKGSVEIRYNASSSSKNNKNNNNNAQLNYFMDKMNKVDSPMASSIIDPKLNKCESSSDESEVEGTCLSTFKINSGNNIERKNDENSTWDEEFPTQQWERQIDLAKIDGSSNKQEPAPKRRCVSTSPNGMSMQTQKPQLYIAYDVLDENECKALSSLHMNEGVRIMSGICSVPKEGIFCAFPAILVTHAIEKPRFRDVPLTRYNSIATCHRTYNYMKAVALGARVVDANWLIDCQASGTLLCCESYAIWSDLESYNSLTAAGSKIEGATVRGSYPFDERNQLKFEGVIFGILDTALARDTEFPQGITKPLTYTQISSLIKCWGGSVTEDSFTMMHVLLIHDYATLNQVVRKLQGRLAGDRNVTAWSIETLKEDDLETLINNDGTMSNSYGDDYRVPIIRAKWFENSICMNSVQSLKEHCVGVLCFEFDMGADYDQERQTLLC
jgi:hypothetical protein